MIDFDFEYNQETRLPVIMSFSLMIFRSMLNDGAVYCDISSV